MKRFTGQSKASELSGLTNSVADGDTSALADMINVSLKRVSDDLQPLSEESETRSSVIPDAVSYTHLTLPTILRV